MSFFHSNNCKPTFAHPCMLTHLSLYFRHKIYLCFSYEYQTKWHSLAGLANKDAVCFLRGRMLLYYKYYLGPLQASNC